MALPNTPVGYDSWNSYIEINAPALAASQGITLQQAKASLKLLNVSEPIRGAVGEPYYREYNVFTTWADRALLPEPGRPWKLAPSFTVLSLFAQGEQGAWYDPSDLTTMYQTSTGTTPVTAAGQQVGLLLDKSQGLVLGPELVTNGDFSQGATGWASSSGGSVTVVDGKALVKVSAGDGLAGITQNITTVIGVTYRVTWEVSSFTGTGWRFGAGAYASGNQTYTGITSLVFVATATTSAVTLTTLGDGSADFVAVFDNISVKLLPGNHATQATSAQRPTLGRNPVTGTRNLLTYTEQFDNAAWTTTEATVVSNAAVAPNGTTTADKIREASGAISFGPRAGQSANFTTGVTYGFSAYVKPDGRQWVRVELPASGFGTTTSAWFDVSSGNLGTTQNSPTTSITDVGSGWYRVFVSKAATATVSGFPTLRFGTADGIISYTGDGTSGILVWGAQLETGSTATAYQRVVSAFDVTQAGVADAWYLSCDGTDDGMVTNTITPGIDKAQVFAGVRKLSDAAIGVVAEMNADSTTNAGSLALFAPQSAGGANYRWRSRGSGSSANADGAIYTAPITNVLTGIGDIAADTAILRVNGTQAASATTDQGTGNYLAYPLYIGRRGGTSLPFNGRIYSLIVRFGANLTQQQILDTETWVGEKTGINIPLWVSPTVYDSFNNPVLDQFNQTIELY